MKLPRTNRFARAGLSLGLAVAFSTISTAPARAQPLSTGSGSGTGTGQMGGNSRNTTGTGQMGGGGPNPTGTGAESGNTITLPGQNNYINPSRGRNLISPNRLPREAAIPAGPGVNSSVPGDATMPLGALTGLGVSGGTIEASAVNESNLRYARAIVAPGDRSLALSRVASAATFSNQLVLADQALADSAAAALEMPAGMVRDQRLISLITAQLYLAEAHLREGRTDILIPDATGSAPALPKLDRVELIHRALNGTRRAARLAEQITNPTYRAELLYRVADGMAFDSQSIINEYPRRQQGGDPGKEGIGLDQSYESLPDQMLREASAIAERIDRPVWRDNGLYAIASAAAESRQFARAKEISRRIPQPEVRTNALLKIAEIQARRGDPKGATSTYQEAAMAVASIPLDDPRAVLAGVLIDNLIAVGRFDDARASIGLYPDEARRMVALGAIAESQGRRGSANSAIAWINRDIPPTYRSQLYRRVSNGVVSAIENNRSRDLSNRNER